MNLFSEEKKEVKTDTASSKETKTKEEPVDECQPENEKNTDNNIPELQGGTDNATSLPGNELEKDTLKAEATEAEASSEKVRPQEVAPPSTQPSETTSQSENKEVNDTTKKAKEWTIKEIRKEWRRFNLDLAPKVKHPFIFHSCLFGPNNAFLFW